MPVDARSMSSALSSGAVQEQVCLPTSAFPETVLMTCDLRLCDRRVLRLSPWRERWRQKQSLDFAGSPPVGHAVLADLIGSDEIVRSDKVPEVVPRLGQTARPADDRTKLP